MSVELQSGSRLGHYELLVQIGRGGMATVWVGRESSDVGDRLVAVKAMLPELAQRPEFRTMFLEEGQIVRAIDHPNVVKIHEVGEDRGILFMAMEWVQGDSLRAVHREARKRGPIPAELAVRIIADTAAGLHAAHELRGWDGELRNLVHCDVSPHNILVGTDGRARLVDFGVANGLLLGDPDENEKVKGKFGYMSPEQARGEPVDRRSDVFSLGIVLFELTTGERLFQGESPAHTLRMVSTGWVANPAQTFPGYPEKLAAIVMTALESDLERRFQTAEQLQIALEQYLVEERMMVSQASVGQLVRRVLGTGLASQQDGIREALVAADGMLRAGLVPESDPRLSRPFDRLSEPPSFSTAGGGPFHQTAGSWPRQRRTPVGPVLFGVLGVASAVAAVIWTSQTKPTALVTAPGEQDKASTGAGVRPRTAGRANDESEGTSEGMKLDAIPVAADPRHPAPPRAAPAPAPRGPRGEPPEAAPNEPPKPADTHEPARETVELEETPEVTPPEADVENPYRKPDEVKNEPPPPGERSAFNRGAATSVLANAARRAQSCKSGDGPSGPGRATITFSPDGPASNVSVSAPFAGTSVGACVATAYRSAQVPPFTGSSVTLPHSFRIP
ncbi:MAG TPA: protein kinase [Polyangiaceae bacterium]|nr:protein kinase [Polyangiaceae bacterium]